MLGGGAVGPVLKAEDARKRTAVAAGQDPDVVGASAAIDLTQQAEPVGDRKISTGEVDDDHGSCRSRDRTDWTADEPNSGIGHTYPGAIRAAVVPQHAQRRTQCQYRRRAPVFVVVLSEASMVIPASEGHRCVRRGANARRGQRRTANLIPDC